MTVIHDIESRTIKLRNKLIGYLGSGFDTNLQTNNQQFLAALCREYVFLDEVIQDLNRSKHIEDAEGVPLDLCADLVGVKRSATESDDELRQRTLSRIVTKYSGGTVADICNCVMAITGLTNRYTSTKGETDAFEVVEQPELGEKYPGAGYPNAAFKIEFYEPLVRTINLRSFIETIRENKPGGVYFDAILSLLTTQDTGCRPPNTQAQYDVNNYTKGGYGYRGFGEGGYNSYLPTTNQSACSETLVFTAGSASKEGTWVGYGLSGYGEDTYDLSVLGVVSTVETEAVIIT